MFGRKSMIIDPTGAPIDSVNAGKIVDLAGRQLGSYAQAQDAGPSGRTFDIKGFLVAAVCSDGNMRQVTLTTKEANKLSKFLKRIHGGKLNLQAGPLFLLVRGPAPNQKSEVGSRKSEEDGRSEEAEGGMRTEDSGQRTGEEGENAEHRTPLRAVGSTEPEANAEHRMAEGENGR